jgi:hypothetical protein
MFGSRGERPKKKIYWELVHGEPIAPRHQRPTEHAWCQRDFRGYGQCCLCAPALIQSAGAYYPYVTPPPFLNRSGFYENAYLGRFMAGDFGFCALSQGRDAVGITDRKSNGSRNGI